MRADMYIDVCAEYNPLATGGGGGGGGGGKHKASEGVMWPIGYRLYIPLLWFGGFWKYSIRIVGLGESV